MRSEATMRSNSRLAQITVSLVILATVSACQREEPAEPPAPQATSADASRPTANPLRNAYFGELHLHTSWSFDAYSFQNTLTDPDAAYRYAKGEEIRHVNGEMVKRNTPLDFAAVTDHAEYMGVAQLFIDQSSALYQKPVAAKLRGSRRIRQGSDGAPDGQGLVGG